MALEQLSSLRGTRALRTGAGKRKTESRTSHPESRLIRSAQRPTLRKARRVGQPLIEMTSEEKQRWASPPNVMAKERDHPARIASDRQRSVAPPDVIRNVARFDAALWTGKGINSWIQKCGVLVLGLFFLGSGCFYIAMALGVLDEGGGGRWGVDFVYVIASTVAIAVFGVVVGWRLIVNSTRRRRKAGSKHSR